MRVLNVAHGEFLMLGAYVTYRCIWAGGPTAPHHPRDGTGGLRCRSRPPPAPLRARARPGGDARGDRVALAPLSFGLLFVLQNTALLVWSADLQRAQLSRHPPSRARRVFRHRVLAAGWPSPSASHFTSIYGEARGRPFARSWESRRGLSSWRQPDPTPRHLLGLAWPWPRSRAP